MDQSLQIIESLLLLNGNDGITDGELIYVLGGNTTKVEKQIAKLNEHYQANNHSFLIKKINNCYKLVVKSRFLPYYQQINNEVKRDHLSNTQLEVLTIIAFDQPTTRFDIEQIRGVSSYSVIKFLLDQELIYISGTKDEIGRPNIYQTTEKFLDLLGLNTLYDLPKISTYEIDKKDQHLFENVSDLSKIQQNFDNLNLISLPTDHDYQDEIDAIVIPEIKLEDKE